MYEASFGFSTPDVLFHFLRCLNRYICYDNTSTSSKWSISLYRAYIATTRFRASFELWRVYAVMLFSLSKHCVCWINETSVTSTFPR